MKKYSVILLSICIYLLSCLNAYAAQGSYLNYSKAPIDDITVYCSYDGEEPTNENLKITTDMKHIIVKNVNVDRENKEVHIALSLDDNDHYFNTQRASQVNILTNGKKELRYLTCDKTSYKSVLELTIFWADAYFATDEIGTYALKRDGSKSTRTGWGLINGNWYYVDDNGYLLKNTTTPDGYFVDENGFYRKDTQQ